MDDGSSRFAGWSYQGGGYFEANEPNDQEYRQPDRHQDQTIEKIIHLSGSRFDDGDVDDFVTLADGIHHVHALGYFTKDGMFAIQVRLG